MHRPHKHGARWIDVKAGSKLRVHPRGKPVLLRVGALDSGSAADWSSLKIDLHDLKAESGSGKSSFKVGKWLYNKYVLESAPKPHHHYIAVKLFSLSAHLVFSATVTLLDGTQAHGRSAPFFPTSSSFAAPKDASPGATESGAKSPKEKESSVKVEEIAEPQETAPPIKREVPSPPPPSQFHAASNLDVNGYVTAHGCTRQVAWLFRSKFCS